MHLCSLHWLKGGMLTPKLTQDTWPISPLNITEFNSLGLITLTPWTVRQIAAFTADPTDEVIDYSHVEFYFNDPNANLESYCERDLPQGSGQVRSLGG